MCLYKRQIVRNFWHAPHIALSRMFFFVFPKNWAQYFLYPNAYTNNPHLKYSIEYFEPDQKIKSFSNISQHLTIKMCVDNSVANEK